MPRFVRRLSLTSGSALALIAGLTLSAQAMTLREAVSFGTSQDATIQALQQDIATETTNIEIAKDGRRPQISLGGSSNSTDSDTGLVLTVSQVLFDWGHVKSLIAAATHERVQAVAELKRGVEELTFLIAELFIQIEMLDSKIASTTSYTEFARRIEVLSRGRVDAGLSNSAEIARARLEIARADERMMQHVSDRSMVLAQLEFLVGRPVISPQRAPDLAFAERFASSAAVIVALANAPDYVAARAGVDLAAAKVDTAKANLKPKIALQAQVRQDLTGGRGRSSAVGISAGMNLTASGFTGRGVTTAVQEHAAARSRLLAVEREIQNQIRSYAQRLQLLRANEMSQKQQLEQAREVLAAYEEQFVGGKRDLLDLLTTGRDLYEAEMAEIETRSDRKQTEYTAAKSVGMLGSIIVEARK